MKLAAQTIFLVMFGTVIGMLWSFVDVPTGLRILGSCAAALVLLRFLFGGK